MNIIEVDKTRKLEAYQNTNIPYSDINNNFIHMRTTKLFIIAVLFSVYGYSQGDSLNMVLRDSSYSIIKFDTSDYCYRNIMKGYSISQLDSGDLFVVDSVLEICISENKENKENKESRSFYKRRIPIGDFQYFFQLVSMINESGDTIVWVNVFCASFVKTMEDIDKSKDTKKWIKKQVKKDKEYQYEYFDWRKDIVCVNDGFNCFWNVVINLKTSTYSDLMVNGI